jgi:hypothetical protein
MRLNFCTIGKKPSNTHSELMDTYLEKAPSLFVVKYQSKEWISCAEGGPRKAQRSKSF